MRFYRLDRTDGGPLPEHPRLKVGAIIRVPRKNSTKPGAQWNPETQNWVSPIWVECDDPTKAATEDSCVHLCGRDFDPGCDGCAVVAGDSGGEF